MVHLRSAVHWGVAAVLALTAGAGTGLAQQAKKDAKPQVEVVFCLDTTGSMGGLINAAKQKIWSISNQIAGGRPTPNLKIGLVAYRDRGDDYVTQLYDLTDDLDAIHGHLMKFTANGGGDFPESVNKALDEAVTKMKWSKDNKTLKIIFLVGDAPPKDYAGEKKYPEICQTAAKNGIIINTIQCGTHNQTQGDWQKICRLAEGSYVQIDASGGPVITVKTPFDKDLVEVNRELAERTVTFGDARMRRAAEAKKDAAKELDAEGAAGRAGFAGKSGRVASYDLIDAVKSGKVKLEELKDAELPTELQKLSLEGRKQYLGKVEQERATLLRKAADLDTKRNAYIKEKLAEQSKGKGDSFDQQVLRIIADQARRANIQYAVEPAKKDESKKQDKK